MRIRNILFALMMGSCVSAHAQDAELYAPAIPEDASLLRVIGCYDGNVTINEVPINAGDNCISDYKVFTQGAQTVSIGDVTHSIDLKPSSAVSVYLHDGKIGSFDDVKADDPAKAVIRFYNLTDKAPVTLFAPKHSTAIFPDVAAYSDDSRVINPLKVTMEAKAGDEVLAKAEAISLKLRMGTSLLLMSKDNGYVLHQSDDKVVME